MVIAIVRLAGDAAPERTPLGSTAERARGRSRRGSHAQASNVGSRKWGRSQSQVMTVPVW